MDKRLTPAMVAALDTASPWCYASEIPPTMRRQMLARGWAERVASDLVTIHITDTGRAALAAIDADARKDASK